MRGQVACLVTPTNWRACAGEQVEDKGGQIDTIKEELS